MSAARYSLLLLYPDAERQDCVAVGAAALDGDGQWHIAMLPTPDKLRAVAGPQPAGRLDELARNLRHLLADCADFAQARAQLGPRSAVVLHEFEGFFAYDSAAQLDAQLQAVMRESVLPPKDAPAQARPAQTVHKVRPHTRARLRRQFEAMGIMARSAGEIDAHKVVRNYPISAQHGLTAEFALRNAVMHVTETVDFEVADDSVRGKTFEAQAKCLVLRAARDAFGAGTECYIVVSGGGAAHAARSVDLLSTAGRLFAAENHADMAEYLDRIARAARATGQLGH